MDKILVDRSIIEQALGGLQMIGYGDSYAAVSLREALAEQAEQDLDTCPGCGGIADNGHDREFPPNPYYCTKCIEQAEQEPVCIDWDTKTDEPIMGYAAPVRTKDLTDDEISKIWDDSSYGDSGIDFARAVIAADREKNK